MNTDKWDIRFLELAKHVAQWSKDPSTKVGAVLISSEGREFVGYNGFPKGVLDSEERLNNREVKYKLVVHAEVNAILKGGDKARGGTLAVWPSFSLPPICNECCKVAIQAGVKEIVGYLPNENDERVQRWKASISISEEMCNEAGISFRGITEPK
jgi:dCMP deaminase